MMQIRRSFFFVLMVALGLCFACEKPSDDDPNDNSVYLIDDDSTPADGDDNRGETGNDDDEDGDSAGNGGSTTNGSSDNGDDGGDSGTDTGDDEDFDDMAEDPTKTDDRETNWDETDIIDDNDQGGSDEAGAYETGDTVTVAQFRQITSAKYIYVKGYIVGCATTNALNSSYVDFEPPFQFPTALLLADRTDERDVDKMISIQLKSGSAIRETLNLQDHPEMHGRKILVGGYVTTYLRIPGIKDVTTDFKIYKQ